MKQTITFFICMNLFVLISGASVLNIKAQEDVKREIAVISYGTGSPRHIRYSDVLIQMALQPNLPLTPPRNEDLRRVLQNMINLSLVSFEMV